MLYLTAALVLFGGLSLLNLALSAAIIRRLRDQQASSTAAQGLLPPGETVAQFDSHTLDGRQVALDDITPGMVVAFFSPTCGACEKALPGFLSEMASDPGMPMKALAVVVGAADQADHLISQLAEVARVVPPGESGPVVQAFAVSGYPSFFLIGDNGVVERSGHSLSTVAPAFTA